MDFPHLLATRKPPAGSSEEHKDSARSLSTKDEAIPATTQNFGPHDHFQDYRPGCLCPIELESLVHGRYRILDKLDHSYRCESWIARDQSSSQLVQLDIFSAKFSEKAANSHHTKLYRKFSEISSKTNYFQSCLDELWIDTSPGDRHFCRVLEFAVLAVPDWEACPDVGRFSAGDYRNLISTLLHGLCELHDQGFTHGSLDIHSLIFTSAEANTLSDDKLRDLLGSPNVKKRDPSKTKPSDNLPSTVVFTNYPEPFIKFNRQTRLRAFPLLQKIGENRPRTITPLRLTTSFGVYCPPETMYKRDLVRGTSWDIWAAGCVIFEIVTGMPLFFLYSGRARLLSDMQDILGDVPDGIRREWDIPDEDLNWVLPFWPFRWRYRWLSPLDQRLRRRGSFLKPMPTPLEQQATPELSDEEHALLLDLLTKMLQFDPSKRISIKEALKHPWFSFKSE